MNWPFVAVLALWVGCAAVVALVVGWIWRLPAAVRFTGLTGMLAAKRQQYRDIAPQLAHARQVIAEAQQVEAELEAMRIKRDEYQEQLEDMEPRMAQLRELDTKINAKIEEQTKLEQDLADMRGNMVELEQRTEQMNEQVSNHDKVLAERSQRAEELQERCDDLARRQETLSAQIAELTSQEQELRKQTETMRAALVEADQQFEKTTNKLKEATKRLEETQQKAHEEELRVTRLKAEAESLEKQHEAFKDMIKGMRAELAETGLIKSDEDPLEDLWQPYFHGQWAIGGKTAEQQRLDAVGRTLENNGLVYPDRVLHAFHTALKVADLSPLVVLAGISGTGKSLLPRIYSDTMGIHFLSLPVQPRWDNPQDMFGFYNYMEHKYKATALARALVQFERHNRDTFAEEADEDLHDRMLLVLLDEMNLARVEYYFSEYLSKLEIRRDVDPRDVAQRRQCEIPLEVGRGHEKFNDVRLYPDRNVLFVGTMNEDESTQSLSDKVLDRSCVLRFGRPKKTKVERPASAQQRAKHSLGFDTWQQWCGDITPPSAGISDRINVLNEIMELVGRPFGHRVGQAIHSYVASYPNWVPQRENLALADQIEQRILPKLRGLDASEGRNRAAFDQLDRILGDLSDETLRKAFQEGRQSQGGLGMNSFIWQGVDRSA